MAVHGENKIKLAALTDKHRQVASLLAQGLGRTEISELVDFTPEYVTWLARDPLFKEYLRDMSTFADARLEAMFDRVADVVDAGMAHYNKMEDRLKAARLQLEVTGRIGKGDRPSSAMEGSFERLATLAERLLSLQGSIRKGETINGTATAIQDIGRDDEGSSGVAQARGLLQAQGRGSRPETPNGGA